LPLAHSRWRPCVPLTACGDPCFRNDVASVWSIDQHALEALGHGAARAKRTWQGIPVLHARHSDSRDDKQAEDIDEDVTLATLNLLSWVETLRTPDLGGLDALTVHDTERRCLLPSSGDAHSFVKCPDHTFKQALELPLVVVGSHELPGREVVWQVAPLTSRSLLVENGVHDLASLVFHFLRAGLRLRDELPQLVPLLVV